ncbi:WhiB family transcription factor [Gordonia phage Octobien14]|uniref:WhiB family transcription factor n=1 Tax=Gordonia phage Octobien14 TaxID=2483673 RepID=A0A3G3M9S7_9CAUD|nr:WhiB family transcription factor [Gordonia phage Octobien14]AYR03213.1 WhiB family transcription factor [Gordonia phage Octobien14]
MSYFRPGPELDWQLSAKCANEDPANYEVAALNELWPEKQAELLCRGCPVRNACYLNALQEYSTSEYAGFTDELDAELWTEGVVRAGRIW